MTIDDREYRITVTDDGEIGGSCGDNLTWSLDGETLTISGSGDMWNFNLTYHSPWYEHVPDIKTVELPEGLTSIGSAAFDTCGHLRRINIPDNVTSIGDFAFAGCDVFTSIEIPTGVTSINERTFEPA